MTTGNLAKPKTSVTYTVTNVTASGATYASANADPDGDGPGTDHHCQQALTAREPELSEEPTFGRPR